MSDHVKKAVTITKEGKDGVLKIDQVALKRILIETAPQDMPIAIISIAGSMRTGKSFILNFLIRYLRRQGWENPNWIDDGKTTADDEMKWRGGYKRDTTGIIIWNEAFIVPNDCGKKIAVFIMDTQGFWNNKTTKENNVKLFTFSTIISSVQILNVMRQVEERDLENLQLCVEYATAATKEKEPQFTLQKLLFLIRDWSFDDNFGVAGGYEYMDHVLESESGRHLKELSDVRDHLRSSFSKLQCFLMPSPGSKVEKSGAKFKVKNKDIEKNFISALRDLVKLLLHPSNLLPKSSNGTPLKPKELMDVILACDAVFGKGGLPPVQTMMVAMPKAYNESALQDALNQYTDIMKKDYELHLQQTMKKYLAKYKEPMLEENQKKRLEEQEPREKKKKIDLEQQKQKEENELREQELREKQRKMDLEHQKQKEENELREQKLREKKRMDSEHQKQKENEPIEQEHHEENFAFGLRWSKKKKKREEESKKHKKGSSRWAKAGTISASVEAGSLMAAAIVPAAVAAGPVVAVYCGVLGIRFAKKAYRHWNQK